MKKTLTLIMALVMALAVIGCAPAAQEEPKEVTEYVAPDYSTVENAVKTGLSVQTSVAGSKDASASANGACVSDVAITAVTIGEDGVIDACVIDSVSATVEFDAAGQIVTDSSAEFLSKNELGDDYGMRVASSIGKEWDEQAAAFAAYCVGKTIDEIKGIAVNEGGAPADADLASSVTLYIGNFIAGVEDAVNKAEYRGASKGDALSLSVVSVVGFSKSASDSEDGNAQADTYTAALTMKDDVITGCVIDSVQAAVTMDNTGKLTSDMAAAIDSKQTLGDSYGMRAASGIGREWNEQADAFCDYIVGKTVADVNGIAVNQATAPTVADLAASVTIGIGNFQKLIEKAGK